MMNIALDRGHAFYFDADDQPHAFPIHRFDRFWRGEPDVAVPAFAGQRVRFAVFHTEPFTSPPRVVLEHYPALTLDADGRVDVTSQQAGLDAEADHLEANDYVPTPTGALNARDDPTTTTTWHPDDTTHRRLLAALVPAMSYRSRIRLHALPSQAEEPRPRAGYGQTGVRVTGWRAAITKPGSLCC